MDGGLVHQSEGRVTQAVIAALALASLVLQSGGSTPLADTTLNNVLKGYGEKVSPRFTDRTSSRPAASRTESLGRCSSPSARPAYISFVLRKSRLLANDLREGELGTVDFMSEVERIKQLPPPHNRWITILAAACAAAAFSRSTGGDWGSSFDLRCKSGPSRVGCSLSFVRSSRDSLLSAV